MKVALAEDDYYLPISAISHYLYCPRQAALIHIEQVWSENELTVSGKIAHENVDRERKEKDHGLLKEYSMHVFSDSLRIIGIADVVEFLSDGELIPVDYKHGRISGFKSSQAQVTAIALCLEEMLGRAITQGAIYHIRSHKRKNFLIDTKLRELTLGTIHALHTMIKKEQIPKAEFSKKCLRCSLISLCMPKMNTGGIPDIFTPI